MHRVTKLSWVASSRRRLDRWAIFPLPNVNPTWISLASIGAMMLIYVWPQHLILVAVTVLVSIFLDWLDGLVARHYNRASKRGYQIDAICDRASEALLCSLFFYPWFYLLIINIVLTGISWRTQIHFVLSIRLLFILAVIFKLMGYDVGFVPPPSPPW